MQPEQKVGGARFTLVKPLGQGGMGQVWLARDERLKQQVALKFLPPEIRGDLAALDDLRREAVRSQRLAHPNIVRIHDVHEDLDGSAFIVMEYVDGPTLGALRLQQPSRVLSWDYPRPLVEQLCAALEYAHGEKVIHRDLKPANMMVDGKGRLKLADFGIAALASDSMSRLSVKTTTSGTLPYMSPRQLAGKWPQVSDDIYALGATLYELLTSKPPFHQGDVTHQVLHEAPEPMDERLLVLEIDNVVPKDVSAMIMACLAKEPGQRPERAERCQRVPLRSGRR
jgi:serine/threonine protein kinase